jgi:hypothetical protein
MLVAVEDPLKQRLDQLLPVLVVRAAAVTVEPAQLAQTGLQIQAVVEVAGVMLALVVLAALAALALSSYATQHLISLYLCSTLLPSGLLLSA